MGRLKTAWLFVFTFCVFYTNAQSSPALHLKLVNTIQGNYSKFQVDSWGNFFVLNKAETRIKKLDSYGDSIAAYDNVRQYGDIATIDVSNPLKILIYYKDFSTIVVLDRFLNPVNTIDLRKEGIIQAQAIASSYDNQFWVYDLQAAKIKKVDAHGNISFASNDLRTAFAQAINPVKIIDNNGLLYLYDPLQGWYIFDYYGGFKQRLAYKNWQNVTAINGLLFGTKKDTLWLYDAKQYLAQPISTSIKNVFDTAKAILVKKNNIYILRKEGIFNYQIIQ